MIVFMAMITWILSSAPFRVLVLQASAVKTMQPRDDWEQNIYGSGIDPIGDIEAIEAAFPGVTKILRLYTEDEIEKFLEDEDREAAVLGFFNLPQDSSDLEVFKEARASADVTISCVSWRYDVLRTGWKIP